MERLIVILTVVFLITGCAEDPEPSTLVIPQSQDEKTAKPNHSFDLQTVTRSELEQVPGLNRNLIEGILAFQRSPGFHRVEDLLAVKGIGEKTWLKIRRHFYVSSQARDSGH